MTRIYLLMVCACAAWAAEIPLTCTAVSPIDVVTVRKDGLTELLRDIVLNCTGGTLTPAGQPIPKANISLQLNTSLTSRRMNANGNLSEAILVIDDPVPANQVLGSVLDMILGTGTGSYPAGAPTVFQGFAQGSNSIVWTDVPILATEGNQVRRLRLTNLRANALPLAVGESILGSVSITGVNPLPITLNGIQLGTVQNGLNFSVMNAGSAAATPSTSGLIGTLRFTEGFASAFKRRNVAVTGFNLAATATSQASIPRFMDTETGFYNPVVTGTAGLADYGTRLKAVFNNVPAGVQIYVSGFNETSPNPNIAARALESCTGAPMPRSLQSNGYFLLTGMEACWEVTRSNAEMIENFDFKVDWITPGTSVTQTQVALVRGDWAVGTSLAGYLNFASSFSLSGVPSFGYVNDGTADRGLIDYAPRVSDQPLGEIRGVMGGFRFPDQSNVGTFNFEYKVATFDPEITAHVFSGQTRFTGLQVAQTASTQRNSSIREGTTNWLTATVSSTTAPASVKVSANGTGLAAGTYSGTVTVTSATPPVTYLVPVTLTIPTAGPRIKSSGYGIASVGSYAANVIAPGEAVAVFGSNFGPAQIVTLKLTNGVSADTILGGTRVLFDGVAAPMIYAVNGVVSCFVPFGVAGKKYVQVEVEHNGEKSPAVTVAVAASVPGLLTADASGGGQGAIHTVSFQLNGEVGSLPNDVVVLYGTGAGELSSPVQDGSINGGGSLKASVRKVFVDGVEVLPDYFGPAPGQIQGVFQVNLRLPTNIRRNANVPVLVQIGDYKSQPGVTIRVK